MWFMYYDSNSGWMENNLQKVFEFDTVEDFWGLFYHLKSPIQLSNGRDLCLFKAGIKPVWEDENNVGGGSWAIQFTVRSENRGNLAQIWVEILLFAISNTIDENDENLSEEICGVAVNVRGKIDRISLWTRNCKDRTSVLKIGQKLKSWLKYKSPLFYYSHDDMKNKSFDNPLYALTD